jgi:CheY-like chemotaxis protein
LYCHATRHGALRFAKHITIDLPEGVAMKDIVDWLLEIEHLAHELYLSAAKYFVDDKKFNIFLKHTASDEAWHYNAMRNAAQYFQQHQFPTSPVSLDDKTKNRIEGAFRKNIAAVKNGTLSVEQLIDCMVETEFSEWNIFFLYVVNTLKEKKPEFEYVAAEMQHHIHHIEHFIENECGYPQKIEKLKELKAIHEEKILVVEDNPVVAGLLEALLSTTGTVHLAGNGQEALERIDHNFYRLIVSDIDMPIMDGLSFYNEAVAKHPPLGEIFLFLTGALSPERLAFFIEKGVPCLQKPASIEDIRRMTSEIIYRLN